MKPLVALHLLTALSVSGCSLLFSSDGSSPGAAAEAEFMIAGESNSLVAGEEIYIARTRDGKGVIEQYDLSGDSPTLSAVMDLAIVPTALASDFFGSQVLYVMGTRDADGDGEEEEYFERISWSDTEEGFADEIAARQAQGLLGKNLSFLGPALPGNDSHIADFPILPLENDAIDMVLTTGRDVVHPTTNDWNDLVFAIDKPIMTSSDPVRCLKARDIGLNQSLITLFSDSEIQLLDGNIEPVELMNVEFTPWDHDFRACAQMSGTGLKIYLSTDGQFIHASQVWKSSSSEYPVRYDSLPLPLPEGVTAHRRIIGLDNIDLGAGDRSDLVVTVADPPTIYLLLNLSASSSQISFDEFIFSHKLEGGWVPTATAVVIGPDGTDRLYISEAKGPPHCYELVADINPPEPVFQSCDSP